MNKLPVLVAILALASPLVGESLILNDAGNYLRCTQTSATEFRLELNIGSCDLDDKGRILLPAQFAPYLRDGRDAPELHIQLALPATGDYRWQLTQQLKHTALSYSPDQILRTEAVEISQPYWLREIRGIEVVISPFQTQEGKLLIADHLVIDLFTQEPLPAVSNRKLNPYFIDIYQRHFANFDPCYQELAEYGSLAVICPPEFRDLAQPWVNWKNQKGIPTTVFSTTETGQTYESIKAFILNLYQADPNLTFVQLIGDYAQVPCLVTVIMGNSGGMDAFYSLLEGDDGYPDIFVGRFSAETPAELYTQIKRSLEYEKELSTGAWLSRAAGVCSNNPPIPGDDDEHNWEHLDNLRTQLLNYGYASVDRIYANEGASVQDLIASLNEGKSLVNYCGEGYPSHWVAPEFWVSDAENLTNTGMLPFIHVVSCWTGQFFDGTCLAEAFMRSRNNTSEEARGAIAVYAAAPEQGIDPPMEAQDHMVELLVTGTKNTIGGLCYNGSCSMIDEYGEGGVYNFMAWNLFGDASLQLRTKPAEEITVELPSQILPGSAALALQTGRPDLLAALSRDGQLLASAFSDSAGAVSLDLDQALQSGDRLLLTLSGFNLKTRQHELYCFSEGQAALHTAFPDNGQVVETGTLIEQTLVIANIGSVPAFNLRAQFSSSNADLIPVAPEQTLDLLLPGAETVFTLSYRVRKEAEDLSAVDFSIVVSAENFSQTYYFQELVHSPLLRLVSAVRAPQCNWINPGDSFSVIYTVQNLGSASLRDLNGELASPSASLRILDPLSTALNLPPGVSGTMQFDLELLPSCEDGALLEAILHLNSSSAPDSLFSQSWLAAASGTMLESFESGDLQTFPWIRMSEQWAIADHGFDGMYCVQSAALEADSVSLGISFLSRQEGELAFYYKKSPAATGESWKLYLNGAPVLDLEDSPGWRKLQFPVAEGHNIVRCVGASNLGFSGCLQLDAISFPARSIFDNARLLADQELLELSLAPGQILNFPLNLSSQDGKYLQYSAVLRKSAAGTIKTEGLSLSCNKTEFVAGTDGLFMFTLYNSNPPQAVNQISISLPDRVLALSASAFSLPAQTAIPFTGELGSISDLRWEKAEGSAADSLRAGVRLLPDAGLRELILPYVISSETSGGEHIQTAGAITLTCSDSLSECLLVSSPEGEIQDGESQVLLLKANQNLLLADQVDYTLCIYYNGSQMLALPVTLNYDPDPPSFFAEPHLGNYPNPVKDHSVFAYAVPQDGLTQLSIYNLRGQKIKTLVRENQGKGYYRVSWLLDSDSGDKVASGIYFCRLSTISGKGKTIKFTVIR